jgi:hypothetical protein
MCRALSDGGRRCPSHGRSSRTPTRAPRLPQLVFARQETDSVPADLPPTAPMVRAERPPTPAPRLDPITPVAEPAPEPVDPATRLQQIDIEVALADAKTGAREVARRAALDPQVRAAEDAVRSAYRANVPAGRINGMVALSDIRNHQAVRDLPRHLVDEALDGLSVAPGVDVLTQPNRRMLTDQDYTDAVIIGGKDRHMLVIEQAPVPTRLVDLYTELVEMPGDWASLTEIRRRLADVPRADLDVELLRLFDAGAINIAPNADQQRITADDRAAAIHIGGKDKHLLLVRVDELAEGDL